MQSVAYKNDNSAYLCCRVYLCPLILIFCSFWFPEHNSITLRNILKVLGKVIEQASAGCPMQE